MAGYLRMLTWSGDRTRVPDAQLRDYFQDLARRRDSTCFFDRFSSTTVVGAAGRLHVDHIDVDETRPTLVFAPGTNGYGLLYGEFLALLADAGINVATFDPRGHGRSEGIRASYTLDDVVDDLHAVARWAGRRARGPLFVGGSSQGGIAAFYLSSERHAPTWLAGAVCHNLADLGHSDSAQLTRWPRLSRLAGPALRALARVLPEWPVPMSAYLDLEREPVRGFAHAAEVLRSDPLTVPFVRLKTLASLAYAPLPQPVAAITTPILVVQADDDTIFATEYVRALLDRMTCDKRLLLYPGQSHYCIVDHAQAVAADVVAWLTREP